MIRALLIAAVTLSTAWAAPPERIAALGIDVEQTLLSLGLADRVVAVTDQARGFDQATRVGMHRRVATEPLLATRPEVVIAGASVGPAEVLEAVKGAGTTVHQLPVAEDLDGVKANLRQIAAWVDAEAAGEQLVASVEAELAMVAPAGGVRVAFLYARGAGTLMLAGTGTGVHAMISAAGATPVGDWSGFRPITDEALASLEPDVLLMTTHGLESLGGEDGAKALPAVALVGDGLRVVAIDDHKVLSMGPSVGKSVQELAEALRTP